MALTGFLGRLARADFADALGIYVTAGMVSLVLVRKRVNSVKVVAVESAELAGESGARDSVLESVIKGFVERHGIDDALQLRRPIYRATSYHGHFGREDQGFPWEERSREEAIRRDL